MGGCSSQGMMRWSQKQFGDRGTLTGLMIGQRLSPGEPIRTYKGPLLSPEKIAVLYTEGDYKLSSIDGIAIDDLPGNDPAFIEFLPGVHTVIFSYYHYSCIGRETITCVEEYSKEDIRLQFSVQPNRVYLIGNMGKILLNGQEIKNTYGNSDRKNIRGMVCGLLITNGIKIENKQLCIYVYDGSEPENWGRTFKRLENGKIEITIHMLGNEFEEDY